MPGQARILSAGRGITGVEKGREQAAYWVANEMEARKAVQENAAKRVDIIKIWVDDRDNTVPKLTPAQYGAIIDEAHKPISASPRTSSTSRTAKVCSRPMSMRSRMAFAIATWMTSS